jgi:prepilin-type N-terminal cleavage/methylation domain-containing protein
MRRMLGVTLAEMMVVIALMGILIAAAIPKAGYLRDWIAVEQSASDVMSLHALTRELAVLKGTRTRLTIGPDTLRVDLVTSDSVIPYLRRPGGARRGVTVAVSVPVIEFHPTGVGRGATNTRVVLTRGKATVTLTNSRLGRLKRRD